MPRIPVDSLQGVQGTDDKGNLRGGSTRPEAKDGTLVTINCSQIYSGTPTAALEVAVKAAQACLTPHFRVVGVIIDEP